MVKGTYQICPCTSIALLHSNLWWFDKIELIGKGFTYSRAYELYQKNIQCVDDIWDNKHRTFCSGKKAQVKFGFTAMGNKDWIMLTSKIIDKCTNLLERHPHTTHPRKWVGFYCDGKDDLTFVLQCTKDFIPSRRIQYHLAMPLMVMCFMVGTHSRCLSKWWRPIGNSSSFFH